MGTDFLPLKQQVFCTSFFRQEGRTGEDRLDPARRPVAPTACNNQPQKIYVLQSAEALETLQKCKSSNFGETLAFLVCYDSGSCWTRESTARRVVTSTHL